MTAQVASACAKERGEGGEGEERKTAQVACAGRVGMREELDLASVK
jgi:hypothetical protein